MLIVNSPASLLGPSARLYEKLTESTPVICFVGVCEYFLFQVSISMVIVTPNAELSGAALFAASGTRSVRT